MGSELCISARLAGGQHIDQAAFSYVGPADKGKFRSVALGRLLNLGVRGGKGRFNNVGHEGRHIVGEQILLQVSTFWRRVKFWARTRVQKEVLR